MYRLCNAYPRALLILALVLGLGLVQGAQATADESTPRAVPAARAYTRAFSSYEALIAYATTIAADQTALNARADALRAEQTDLNAMLVATGVNPGRGGRLVDPDAARNARSPLLAASARLAAVTTLDKAMVNAGALSATATPWRIPTEGEITQPFGPTDLWMEPARSFGGVGYAHFHEGVDIAGAWAADVVAPARGRVVFAGRMVDGAEVVVLAHDGGIVSLYAHLDAWYNPPTVAAGDEVTAGQKIGNTGMTGMTTGVHLHWAVWRSGELIDPLGLIGK